MRVGEPEFSGARVHHAQEPIDGAAADVVREVLGRIVRVIPLDDGSYELGFTFAADGPPGA